MHQMYQTHQELIKRQSNKPEKQYVELTPGTPVWVQHRQNTTWEPATVISQCTPNLYWIIQENGSEQPKVFRCTRHMLKIRSTPLQDEQSAQPQHCPIDNNHTEFHIPPSSNGNRNKSTEQSTNCLLYTSPSPRDATLSRMPSSA